MGVRPGLPFLESEGARPSPALVGDKCEAYQGFDEPTLQRIYQTALNNGLSDPARRGLLHARTGMEHNLPVKNSPGEQLLSDLVEMNKLGAKTMAAPMHMWLVTASQLTNYMPAVGSHFESWMRLWIRATGG